MTRTAIGLAALGLAAIGPAPAADPAKNAPPVEFVLTGGEKPARVELNVEVGGVPVPAIWDETFAKLFAYFDRNGDGALDEKEAIRLSAPRAIRHALGNGFTPPVGTAPAFKDLDRDGDGKVTPGELAAFYRAAGVGGVQVGVGRLPAGADLTAALLKNLDADGDGRVTEKEWATAPESLRKLDKNDDELIGVGELVPKSLYPGATGAVLLTPPGTNPPVDVVAKLPLVLLPADAGDTRWAAEVARRNGRLRASDLPGWRKQEPDARWSVRLDDEARTTERFTFVADRVRVDGWVAAGGLDEALASARRQINGEPAPPTKSPKQPKGRRGPGGLDWLTPTADRDGDGQIDRKELDAWLDLQVQIARGQVLLTVLDGGGLFELLDANHDGALSPRELRAARDRVAEAGCMTDGAFDQTRLRRTVLVAASRGYPQSLALGVRRGPDWFRAMDRNGDGDVSRREFTGPAAVFDKLDLDKDGLLSPEEAEKANAIAPKK